MPKRVFISYSHDSGAHVDRVLALAERLRIDGLDVRLDQWVASPSEGWPKWMERQLVEADAVVLVCTPTYLRRFEANEAAGTGHGASWEGMIARQTLYDAGSLNHKLIPIHFEGGSAADVPLILRGATRHRLADADVGDDPGYEGLYRQLTDQPRHVPPAIGQVRRLPPIGRGVTVEPQPALASVVPPPLARAEPVERPSPSPSPPMPIVLFSANATLAGHHLQLERELAAIEAAIRSARCRERYPLRICPAATVARILAELDELEPAVVHVCGHADRTGSVLLLQDDGSELSVSPELLAGLFAELGRRPRLVVFATCSSYETAKVVGSEVERAIGFEGEIYDDTASMFCTIFYERLASHPELDVERAFRLAKIATIASGYPDAERARLVP